MNNYPKTKEEWWKSVDNNWKNIRALIVRFLPREGKEFLESFVITAPAAEHIRLLQVKDILKENLPSDIAYYAEILLSNRDPKLLEILNKTWWGMPESIEIRDISGFGVLCDLCSEGYLLEKEDDCKDNKVMAISSDD